MFLKNFNNIITGNKENDNLIQFKQGEDLTKKKFKNQITHKNIKNLKKKKLKNLLKGKKTKDITKHNPYTIDEENPDEKNVLNKVKNIIKNQKRETV